MWFSSKYDHMTFDDIQKRIEEIVTVQPGKRTPAMMRELEDLRVARSRARSGGLS